ncbi:MAG: oxygenase MpaB family protein [Pseudonocardia sp.]
MDEDLGLFGPDSVTWRIHTDPVMWVAAFYALSVQSLHPPTMWATWQHSALFDRKLAMARLLRTGDFVAVRTFGSLAEVEQIGRRVRGIHRRLRGRNPETGAEFRVDEPENLRWVHCGEIVAYLRVAQRAGVPLTAAEADAYVDEQRRSAAVVGLDPAYVPGSVAALDAYFQGMLPELRLTDEAKAAMRMWANTPAPARLAPLKVIYPAFAALSLALLPGWARRLYGLPAHDFAPADLAATATLRATRAAMMAAPQRYRGTELQMRHITRARALMTGGRVSAA